MALTFQHTMAFNLSTLKEYGAVTIGSTSFVYTPYDSANPSSTGLFTSGGVIYLAMGQATTSDAIVSRVAYKTTTALKTIAVKMNAVLDNTNASYRRKMVISSSSSISNFSTAANTYGSAYIRFTSMNMTFTVNLTKPIPANTTFYIYLCPGDGGADSSDVADPVGKWSTIYAPQQNNTSRWNVTGTDVTSYNVTYNANGGTGAPSTQKKYAG